MVSGVALLAVVKQDITNMSEISFVQFYNSFIANEYQRADFVEGKIDS